MNKRPLSLTIIGWCLAISVAFGIYGLFAIQSNAVAMQMIQRAGLSLAAHRTFTAISLVGTAACSYGVFKGLPWGRVLYVVLGVIGIAVGWWIMPIISVTAFNVLFYAVIVFFLFRPRANEWFAARGFQLQRDEA
jgi:hypothetical protein